MPTFEKRLDQLEMKSGMGGNCLSFKIRFIRASDMAVVSELCKEPGKEQVWVHHAEHCATAEVQSA